MTMNILINLFSSSKEQNNPFHGGNEYTNRIVLEAIKINTVKFFNRLHFYCSNEKFIDKSVLKEIEQNEHCFLIVSSNSSNLEEVVKKYKIERLFDPLGVSLGEYNLNNVEVIYTIHGLRPIETPTDINEFHLEGKLKYIIKNIFSSYFLKRNKLDFEKSIQLKSIRKNLIVVSEHTKNSIIALFNIDADDISVFYSPEKNYETVSILEENDFFLNNTIIPNDYFLLVSAKRWVKNTYRAIKAFDELIDKGLINKKIVLTGVNDKVKKLVKNKEMFIFLDYLPSKELEILYKNAFCFVYPSLNEGFGYPPLEAMKYGTPVIASMITAIPEIVGDSCLKFNPYSILELQARIIQIQNDNKLNEKLNNMGIERYKLISQKQTEDLNMLVLLILSK